MSLSLIMLRAGSADTIIARRQWCIRPSTPTSFIPTSRRPERYALVVSALVPYKRIDVAIDACRLGWRAAHDRRRRSRAGAARARGGRVGRERRRFSAAVSNDDDPRSLPARRGRRSCPAKKTSASCRVEAQACGRPVVALGRGGAAETIVDGRHGRARRRPDAGAFADAMHGARRPGVGRARHPRATPSGFSRSALRRRDRRVCASISAEPRAMVNRHNRLLVTFHVLIGRAARRVGVHHRLRAALPHEAVTALIPVTKASRRSGSTSTILPFIALLVPLGFQLQGLYRLRRGRSRVDDFFAVFVGTILAVVFGIVARCTCRRTSRRARPRRAATSRCRRRCGRSSSC